MDADWEQLRSEMSDWLPPEALDAWADAVTSATFNPRVTVLRTAEKLGRGRTLGRALQLLDGFRDDHGRHYPATWNIVVGTIRYLFWMQEGGATEDDVVERFLKTRLRKHQTPEHDMSWQINDTFMNPLAGARNPEEFRLIVRGFEQPPTDDASVVEARDWLRQNEHPAALAGNRFPTTAEALAFVEALYAAGAKKVVADNVNDENVGSYSDSLNVSLPKSRAKRAKIFQVINDIGRPETDGGPVVDDGEDKVGLWWD
jgi:hypothetical protein